MTKKEKILIAKMLKIASDVFANRRCNDLDKSLANNWSKEEHSEFMKKYFEINNEEPDEELESFLCLGDSILMECLADMLLKECE